MQKKFIYSIIFLIAVGFFTSSLAFADSHEGGDGDKADYDGDGGDSKYSGDGEAKESGDASKNEHDDYSYPSGMPTKEPLAVYSGLDADRKKFLEQKEALEKEKLQLDKEERVIIQELELLRIQIFNLSLTIDQFKDNDVSPDKIEELEDQLSELEFDKSDLEDSKVYLKERQDAYEEKLEIHQDSFFARTYAVNPKLDVDTNLDADTSSIPPWFKSNAKWWKQGLISDGDIVNALESLIVQDVIPLDNFIKVSSGLDHVAGVPPGGTFVNEYGIKPKIDVEFKIPSYQKDVFGFWSEGLVSDSEIMNSIGHLMSEGIINSEKIQTEIAQKQNEKWEETDEWQDPSDWPSSIPELPQITNSPYYEETDEWEDPSLPNDSLGENKLTNLYDSRIAIFFPDNLPDEFKDNPPSDYLEGIDIEILECNKFSCSDSIIISEPIEPIEGGMQQLLPVTVLNIGGTEFPISQFALWKWTGECDDAWHYHTPTSQAIAIDGVTGIMDPDLDNCGFGKVGHVFAVTSFMSQSQIDKFKERTNSDPLTNEAMMGGSDTGSNTVSKEPTEKSLEDELDELKNKITPYDGPKVVTGPDFADFDGDGIEDSIDPEPEIPNNEFGGEKTESGGLIGKIVNRGDLTVTIHNGGEDGMSIQVGTDGNSKSVIVEIMGVELEIERGTIMEGSFG